MERPQLRAFIEKAGSQLAGIRGGLLLAAQNGFSSRDIENASARLAAIETDAAAHSINEISGFADRMRGLTASGGNAAISALDILATAEAALLQFSLDSEEFLLDVDGLVEESFKWSESHAEPDEMKAEEADSEFEIDDETLEIFQEEAEGLLANISTNLSVLASSPGDTNALWEIRRSAHTFKGAAGIVGLKAASSLAHRVEDLLDRMVESHIPADRLALELLSNAASQLETMSAGTRVSDDVIISALGADLDAFLTSLSSGVNSISSIAKQMPTRGSTHGTASTPIVRVSLDRLDELITLSKRLATHDTPNSDLANEISLKLLKLRMVRFGTLETRLTRAVHVTCQEEDKRADLVLAGGDVEVDTQIIDALIEPLLHLLKNAVVHGIEPAETRRLLGKPEKACITVDVAADDSEVAVIVTDDGGGISTEGLVRKAIETGVISVENAQSITEKDAVELIYHRGLTTAASLSMNAGRGIGMSIVRQGVEDHGGTLTVESEPQKGSAFTIKLPVSIGTDLNDAHRSAAKKTTPLVLVVEDSSSIRHQTVKFIENAGLRAITAVDGAEALELLLNGVEPDLVLSDVEMPNMNGWELLEYVKTDDNFGHVPVVMVTSLDSDNYRSLAKKLGASDYVVKPFGAKELERILEEFCTVTA